MPQTRLTCPHCEQEVEINVTDVTRSRNCPLCGKYIILQFTTKAARMKRKALLTPTVQLDSPATAGVRSKVVPRPQTTSVVTGRDAAPAPAAAAPRAGASVARPAAGAVAPAPLAGGGGERNTEPFTPESLQSYADVQRAGRRLLWGTLIVASLIAVVVAADRLQWWKALGEGFSKVATYVSPAQQVPVGQSNKVEVDPSLPSAKEVLSSPMDAPAMKLPDEVDGGPTENTTPGVMSEQEKAMRGVQTFLEAPGLKERLRLVRDQALIVDRMVKYYETNDPGPIPFQKIVARETSPAGVLSFAFNVILKNGDERRVVVARSVNGQYLVDWASFVVLSDMSWKEFMETKPVTPTLMRVMAQAGEHFTETFPGTASVVCLKLTDPLSKDSPPIYGYATQGTPLGMALEFISRKSTSQEIPVIVTLKYPQTAGGMDASQVWVDELVAEGWLARGR